MTLSESLSVLRSPDNPTVAHLAAWIPQHSLMLARTMPYLELRNTSDAGQITQFTLTIGDTTKNFDWATLIEASPGVKFTLQGLDAVTGSLKNDVLTINFTGFDPGDFVRFRTGLSPDSSSASPIVDYRTTLFQLNGSNTSHNSVTTVTYQTVGGPQTLTTPLPNFTNPLPTATDLLLHSYGSDSVKPFILGGSGEGPTTSVPVPEPSSLVLAGFGLAALIAWKARRRRIPEPRARLRPSRAAPRAFNRW